MQLKLERELDILLADHCGLIK